MEHVNLSFSSIVGKVLNESGTLNYFDSINTKIFNAIKDMNYVYLYYDDKKGDVGRNPAYGNPRDSRRLIPYCFGIRKGRFALRAFHANPMHTKKGPYKWKFMYVDNIKGFRVLKNHFSMDDIPPDANPNGDKHMDEIIIYVGMDKGRAEEWERNHDINTGDFVSPVQRTRKEKPNPQGAITKVGNGNVNSLANLNYTPGKYNNGTPKPDYKAAQKNLRDFNANNDQATRQQRFADYDKARAEADRQNAMQRNNSGPVTTRRNNNINPNEEEEGYDEYMRNNNNI